jgi:cell division protein ZapA
VDSQGERKSVRVTIYNQPYTLGVTGDPTEVEELAQTVDNLMMGIAQRAGNIDSTKVAVLACLELADRLRDVERKSQEFTLLLDQACE